MTYAATYTMESCVEDVRQYSRRPRTRGRRPARSPGICRIYCARPGGWRGASVCQQQAVLDATISTTTQSWHPEGGFLLMCEHPAPRTRLSTTLPWDTWGVYGVTRGHPADKVAVVSPETDRAAPELKPLESWVQGPGDIAFFLPGETHHTRCVADDRAVVSPGGPETGRDARHRYDPKTNTAQLYTSEA